LHFSSKTNYAFTLVELLVVIAIIGLLASVTVVAVNGARAKARDAKRHTDIKALQTALQQYYEDNGQYPLSGGSVRLDDWSASSDSSWNVLQTALAPYMARLPTDPTQVPYGTSTWAGAGAHLYSYYSGDMFAPCGDRQWYQLVYFLEIPKGPDPGGKACKNGVTVFRYGGTGANTAIKTLTYFNK